MQELVMLLPCVPIFDHIKYKAFKFINFFKIWLEIALPGAANI